MGFFDSIVKGVSNVVSSVKNVAVKALDTNAAVFSHPITAVTQGIPAAIQQFKSSPVSTNVKNIVATTAVAAGTILTAGTTAGRAAVTTIAKTLIPKTATQTAVAAVAAPVAISAVLTNPSGTAKTAANVVKAQVDLGKTIANPSLTGFTDFVKEHPIATLTTAAVGTLAAGSAVLPVVNAIETRANTKAVQANTASSSTVPAGVPMFNTLPVVTQSPQTPATVQVAPTPSAAAAPVAGTTQTPKKKRKKSTKKKKKTRRSKKSYSKKRKSKNIKRRRSKKKRK